MPSLFKLNKKCNTNTSTLMLAASFYNVPEGRIIYDEQEDKCYDVGELIKFMNGLQDDVPYTFPLDRKQIQFDFMKLIAKNVFEYNINLANYYLQYEGSNYLAEKGLIYYETDNKNNTIIDLLIGSPIELNTMTTLMLIDIWQPKLPPTTLIKLILLHKWTDTKENRDFLYALKKLYKRIAVHEPRNLTSIEQDLLKKSPYLSKTQKKLKKKLIQNPRRTSHKPTIADYINCYSNKFSKNDILLAMDVDLYFRTLIQTNQVDTSNYTSFQDVLEGISKLRSIYKRYIIADIYNKSEIIKITSQRASDITVHLDDLNYNAMQEFFVELDKSLNAVRLPKYLDTPITYESMKYSAKYYNRNKNTLKTTPVVKFVLADILINSKDSIIKDIWKKFKDHKTFANKLTQYLIDSGFVYMCRAIWKNGFLGSWNKLNIKYNSSNEIVQTNYSPDWGIFNNQTRCATMLKVLEK